MGRTDISKFTKEVNSQPQISLKDKIFGGIKAVLWIFWKAFSTLFLVTFTATIIIGISMIFYIVSIAKEPLDVELTVSELKQTSFIYVYDEYDMPVEYQRVYSSENRVWVDYKDIPEAMIKAIICIEDKRFREHDGVDWVRTAGAILNIASGSDSYGGSTITQQLIKNITGDDEVSLTRKLREIFRALKLEQKYTKDQILESYLNIVSFGIGCQGVQAAANLYFNKDIGECSIAECAAIAGITQNPVAFTPLSHPEKNKEKRETVIQAMYDQGAITKTQYEQAMLESENMTFVGFNYDNDDDDDDDDEYQNWYMDALYRDVVSDLANLYGITKSAAEDKFYDGGLKIYCAMDLKAQQMAEDVILNLKTPYDPKLELGYVMMDFDGRVICTVGSRNEKEGLLVWDNASQSVLQSGSTMKPIGAYSLAIDSKEYNFSSIVSDRPVKAWRVDRYGNYVEGPDNWYHYYKGDILLEYALEISCNAAAVQLVKERGVGTSYDFMTKSLGFTHLDDADAVNLGGVSIGGFTGGVTVKEMTAAYQIFGNGGKYYKPYTYYYITDSNDNVILDNRNNRGVQAISEETSTIMNRLLRQVVVGYEGTGKTTAIDGWNIVGKTGTTDANKDSWYIGLSPYAVAGIWTGYDLPATVNDTYTAQRVWKEIMSNYLNGSEKYGIEAKDNIDYEYSGNVVERDYCTVTGKLAHSGCPSKKGYYTLDNMPGYCTYHSEVYYPPDEPDDDDNQENGDNQENNDNNNQQDNDDNNSEE